ncbi:MAG: tetratricopeptide repeat protein, partial [Gammaproteobacteria bacterium]|nr:tetratricopeptide repeat protein [Gammaproteobacteria bacterium]
MGIGRGLLKILLTGCALFPAWAVAGEVLKAVQVEEQGDITVFRAEFVTPLEYVKHFPSSRGKILQIQLHSIDANFPEDGLKRRETLQPQSTSGLITEVIYEGNVKGGPFLVLRFENIVAFKIKEGRGSVIEVRLEREVVQTANAIPGILPSNADDQALAQLLEQGRRDLLEGRYNEAIFRFTQITQQAGNPHVRDAKEYIGVARERLGQYALAKDEYESYIKAYPDDDRTRTVQQRLMSVKARDTQVTELRQVRDAARSEKDATQNDVFGRISTMYLGGVAVNRGESNFSLNSLNTYVDVTGRTRTAAYESRLLFSGNLDYNMHDVDYVTGDIREEAKYRIRSVQYEYRGKLNKTDVSVGRQSTNRGGVLGRYDGAFVAYKINPKMQASIVAGLPLDYLESLKLNTDNPMIGGALEFPDILPNFSGSAFVVRQEIGGFFDTNSIMDRQAIGADLRYFSNKVTAFSFADYDLSYKALNNVTAHVGGQLNPVSNVSFHVDIRRSPYLLTNNAINGLLNAIGTDGEVTRINEDLLIPQEMQLSAEQIEFLKAHPTVAGMRAVGLSEAYIRARAAQVSGDSKMYTLGLTRDLPEFGPDYQLNVSASYSTYQSVPVWRRVTTPTATLKVGELQQVVESATRDLSVYSQLMIRNVFVERDMQTINLRTSTSDGIRRLSVGVSQRLPYQSEWNFDLRMRLDFLLNAFDVNEVKYAPSAHAEYRVNNT